MPLGRIKYGGGLAHVAGCEGAVETGGEFFPSGFTVVATMCAFVLQLAAK